MTWADSCLLFVVQAKEKKKKADTECMGVAGNCSCGGNCSHQGEEAWLEEIATVRVIGSAADVEPRGGRQERPFPGLPPAFSKHPTVSKT